MSTGTRERARPKISTHAVSDAVEKQGRTMRAVLYARVSTDEQANKGYSLAQQKQALRDYALSNGYEILDEIEDQSSGAYLERPGLDRVRDLVRDGGVSVVLAQDRDRISREPAYFFILKREFKQYGTVVRALNQRDDDSPEGELSNAILDELAKFERAKIAERTRRGRLRKAKEGRVVGAGATNFGFVRDGDSLRVNPDEMEIMRQIYRLLADGKSIYEVVATLKEKGVKAPRGGVWHHASVRPFVLNDVYKAHTVEELSSMVSPDVLSKLDPDKRYGVQWYNRRRKEINNVSRMENGERVYKNKVKTIKKPRDEWVAVPVPDSGIPRELVDKARSNIIDNKRISKNGGVLWELSGGIAICGGCGRRMTTVSVNNRGKPYNYYRCPVVGQKTCPNRTYFRADELEDKVISTLRNFFADQDNYRLLINDFFDKHIEELRRRNPDKEGKTWSQKIITLQQNLSRAKDLAIDGLLSKDELREKVSQIQEDISKAERELEGLNEVDSDIRTLERNREVMLQYNIMNNLLDRYAPEVRHSSDESEPPEELSQGTTVERRHQLYKDLNLKVFVSSDTDIELEMAGTALGVSKFEKTS